MQESFYCKGSKQGPAAGTLEDRISYLRRLSYGKEGVPKLKRIRDVQQACQKKKPDTRLGTIHLLYSFSLSQKWHDIYQLTPSLPLMTEGFLEDMEVFDEKEWRGGGAEVGRD